MRIPGFTAPQALDRSLTQYRTKTSESDGAPSVRTIYLQGFGEVYGIPNKKDCWCSEPDYLTVCDYNGNCFEKAVCLQWFCPKKYGKAKIGKGDYFLP